MEPKEAPGKENMGTKKKNLPFLRPRLYMLERRKTDTVVESSIPGDHSGTLRRSNRHLRGIRSINVTQTCLTAHSMYFP